MTVMIELPTASAERPRIGASPAGFDPRGIRTSSIGSPRLLRGLDDRPELGFGEHRGIHGDHRQLDRAELLTVLDAAGLTGRGGAGFPLADKVRALRPGRPVVVINGAEGEPGSAKDAVLLSRVPHLVLDGAAVLADAIGALQTIVAVTDVTVEHFARHAVGQRPDAARFEVRRVPARFIAGEGRTLVRVLSGGPQLPPGRRIHATEHGVGGAPTLLANVETFAHVAILTRTREPVCPANPRDPSPITSTSGANTLLSRPLAHVCPANPRDPSPITSTSGANTLPPTGTETGTTITSTSGANTLPPTGTETGTTITSTSGANRVTPGATETGTTLLSVTGAVSRPGVVEVPIGLPLGELAAHVGAFPSPWVVVGGYHGAWLVADPGLPLSRAGLRAAGGTLGAGTVMFVGADTCPSAELSRVADWLGGESARQCGPCAFGLPSLAAQVHALRVTGEPAATTRRQLAQLPGRGACAHPDGAARFLTSGLNLIARDLAAHQHHDAGVRPERGHLDRGHLATDRIAAFTPRARS